MIDLEDFSPLLESEEEKNQESKRLATEEIEKIFQEKFLEIQKKHSAELESAKKKSFEEGFKKGFLKAKEELKISFQEELQNLQSQYQKKLDSLQLDLNNLEKEISQKYKEFLKKVEEVIISSIAEILEFLYINPTNSSYVAKKIEELLKEFPDEDLIEIEVGKELSKHIKFDRVQISENLANNDFSVKFKDFSIESKIKEKLNLLREEIEREIKKSS
ncbi:hypothetical protein Dester_1233 [Desulfurobacterium thermolithotrophum DSM 11699]|uniref:Flagellar assembly protein FliH/Type III secretion system HrpE domain-containing protein n=1 Tax=Desulfurobacterium thermolithotrophum (strain DSM 11699 / BSA) TaxID=868864 RepID=F0S0R6_DESTD|nr:hypothetical protein [Desulfurobacterium thermolithotrophum]ADY73869.1 hypothetical protein Dester_1233 [Desulfurobacterium thermolithotrophum DSM 11699]